MPAFDDVEYNPTVWRQIYAVLTQVALQGTRNSFTLMYVIFYPVVFAAIVGAVNLGVKPDPIAAVQVNLDTLAPGSVAYSPDDAATAGWLGQVAGAGYADAAALADAVSANSAAALVEGEWGVPTLAAAVDVNQAEGWVALTYNHQQTWSARGALRNIYDGLDGVDGGTSPTIAFLKMESQLAQNSFGVGGLTGIVAMTFAILGAFYCEEMLRIRVSRVKDMLMLAGLRRSVFWGAYFISHQVMLVLSGLIALAVLAIFGMEGVTDNNILAYIVLFIVFGIPNIWSGYLLGFFVNKVETAQEAVGEMYNLFLMIPWIIVTFALEEQSNTAETLLSVIPGFGLYRGFAILEAAAKNGTPFSAGDIFDWDKQLAQSLLVMFLTGCCFCGAVLFIDYGYWEATKRAIRGGGAPQASAADLMEEEASLPPMVSGAIAGGSDETLPIRVKDARKTYAAHGGQPPFAAVKGVTFDVKTDQILGLLGPNGAGKTSLMHSITHMEGQYMDSGDALVNGHSTQHDLENARVYMGICPQHDALNEFLSAREHLRLLARIRGVPDGDVEAVVQKYINAVSLAPKADARCGKYSGGNKRRLSVAMGLIGSTKAVFLDEPSTGMDPVTRRHMWSFLEAARHKRSVVLTTHSMAEADALCQRIAIMIRGGVRTIGTSQQLKNMHGRGHLVSVRVAEPLAEDVPTGAAAAAATATADGEAKDADGAVDSAGAPSTVLELIQSLDKDAVVTAASAGSQVHKFSLPTASLSSIFAGLTTHGARIGVADFTVTQVSLEDVFLGFARNQ